MDVDRDDGSGTHIPGIAAWDHGHRFAVVVDERRIHFDAITHPSVVVVRPWGRTLLRHLRLHGRPLWTVPLHLLLLLLLLLLVTVVVVVVTRVGMLHHHDLVVVVVDLMVVVVVILDSPGTFQNGTVSGTIHRHRPQ